MDTYVLDASVVVSLLLGKDNRAATAVKNILEEAEKGQTKAYSLPLLVFEVGNSLRYALVDSLLADEPFQQFLDLPISYFELEEGHNLQILKESYSLKTSFYDTAYHFLALLLGGIFLTANGEYFKKSKHLGHIKLL